MAQTIKEVITVEGKTQYGLRVGGKNYYISKNLETAGTTKDSFLVGSTYSCDIYVSDKGAKYINTAVPYVAQPIPAIAVNGNQVVNGHSNVIPFTPPSLPPTTVVNTPPPGGVSPVTPAVRGKDAADEKMAKADWAAKDRSIEIQAILKSTIESGALAQAVVGKPFDDIKLMTRQYFLYNLSLLDEQKA